MSAAKAVLFTDARHIRCGDLEWRSPAGERLPVAGPPEPQVEAQAHPGSLPRGIRLEAQPAEKTEPLRTGPPGRVIHEGGVYRSWGLAVEYPPGQNLGAYATALPSAVAIRYAESQDGFAWEEKARCAIAVPGQKAFDGYTFFVDPQAPAAERYKAVYTAWPPAEERPALWQRYQQVHPRHKDLRLREDHLYCLYGLVSADGLHWQPLRDPLLVHHSDTDTTVYCDAWLGRYVMYTRLYWQERRWVGRAEAEDFRRWGPVEPLLWPSLKGLLSDDIYTNCRTEYPGLPHYHLMFPMVYHRHDQTSQISLYSSADGICWMEVPGGPVIAPGEGGAWDREYIFAGNDLVALGQDRVALRYSGTSFPHKYPRWPGVLAAGRTAWAWWPKGRLAGVVADQEGEFFTFPMAPAGRQLRLNLRTRRAGQVRVGVVGAAGRSVEECAPLAGDHLALPVCWKGETDIGAPEGQPVALHFKLRAAAVFGFEWV
jgi:hypothetical protein